MKNPRQVVINPEIRTFALAFGREAGAAGPRAVLPAHRSLEILEQQQGRTSLFLGLAYVRGAEVASTHASAGWLRRVSR